ncbi:MAG: glycosyltransferase [Aggregatilineales bacterium]
MLKILIIVDYYLPGYKGGGPIRTIANLVDWLGDEFNFYILTRDHDLGNENPYSTIQPNTWTQNSNAQIYYASSDKLALSGLQTVLNSVDFDVLYVNSFFSSLSVKIAYLRWRRLIADQPFMIAPRGEFYAGALNIKPLKKQLYLFITKRLRWYRNVKWVASTPEETATLKAIFPNATDIHIAPNLTAKTLPPLPEEIAPKEDKTRIVFFSRISPKKNLDGALRLLHEVDQPLEFDIYGTLEDSGYWQTCQHLMATLPAHISATYKGALQPEDVTATLANYHLMLFPTHGENFGHVIWEALYAGVPVLISDQTPWHDIEQAGVGWEVALDDRAGYVERINHLIRMDDAEFTKLSRRAHTYAIQVAHDEAVLQANRRLFLNIMNG